MSSQGQDKLIRVEQVAEMTGLSPCTIYRQKAGTTSLLRVKLGRSLRFSYLNVLDWIEDRKRAAVEASAEAEHTQEPIRLRLVRKPALDRKTINRILKK